MSDVLTASELLVAFRERRLSPVEVLEALLPGIGADAFNAFSRVDAEGALAQARASEERWQRGAPVGALDGVPVAIKDAFPARGWPTRRGSRAIDAAGPWDEDASAVAALRRNGAVLPVQTTSPEFGWKGVTDSPLYGVTRNPWDPATTPGGSSGGSAAALAAGLVPLALGSDGAGSIRIPCGFTGLPGLKPTFGRVPLWPPSAFGTVSHAGPMARTVTDAALLLDVMCEPDARDWTALPPPAHSFLDGLDDGIAGTRIAFSPDLGYVTRRPRGRRGGRASRPRAGRPRRACRAGRSRLRGPARMPGDPVVGHLREARVRPRRPAGGRVRSRLREGRRGRPGDRARGLPGGR